jgi:predicted Fe-S protein YdhL (DUF1289 family)
MTTDPTLTARHPYSGGGEPYSNIYGVDEWEGMTQDERQAIIDDDLAREQSEKEAEAQTAARQQAEDAAHEARAAALDAIQEQAEKIIAQHGMTVSRADGSGALSRYLTVTFQDADGYDETLEVRISDHDKPPGGGYNQDDECRQGESDVLLDIRNTPERNAEILSAALSRAKGE